MHMALTDAANLVLGRVVLFPPGFWIPGYAQILLLPVLINYSWKAWGTIGIEAGLAACKTNNLPACITLAPADLVCSKKHEIQTIH